MKRTRTIARYLLGIFFIVAGIGHFIMPDFYLRMMPDYLPAPYALIYVSGVIEAFLGVLAFLPGYFFIAKWGMLLLLLAVFPANIHMAKHPELFAEFSSFGLWLRLPFQLLFAAWVWFSLNLKRTI